MMRSREYGHGDPGAVEDEYRGHRPIARPVDGRLESESDKVQIRSRPVPKSLAANFEPSEDGSFRHTIYIVDAQSRASHTETIAKADGQDYRTVGTQRLTTRANKRIDDRTPEITVKTGGNAQTNRFVFSPDGKTMTGTATGKDAQGDPWAPYKSWRSSKPRPFVLSEARNVSYQGYL